MNMMKKMMASKWGMSMMMFMAGMGMGYMITKMFMMPMG